MIKLNIPNKLFRDKPRGIERYIESFPRRRESWEVDNPNLEDRRLREDDVAP